MDDLRCSCFKTYPMLSHNGIHDDYIGEIQKYGHADKPLGINGQPVEYHMFDGTPLYSDKAALEKFWKARQPAGAGLAYSGVTRYNPYAKDARKPELIASEIPSTAFFAENYDSAVMKAGLGHIYKAKGGSWAPLPAYAGIPDGTIPEPGDFRRVAE